VSVADTPRRALLVGGTSEIGLAIVRRLAPEQVWLLGRDGRGLERAAAGLDGAAVHVAVLEADDVDSHPRAIESAFTAAGGFDVVVLAVGVLGGQAGLDADNAEAIEVMRVNFLGAGSLLLECLRQLRERGDGSLVLLSSAAVERPRASNPVYGAAKAGLDALAQGLSDAIWATGVRVLVVRPGFVKTRMTAGLKPAPFATTPEAVASATVAALARGTGTIWVPAALRWVFAVLRHLPRVIYRRLPL
jgi:decaprenylphospho-beta-D-erythro-pentofuranosid-2-ulose 2-reductase